jgi:septum formation protein
MIVLASRSPRRRSLLAWVGYVVEVRPSQVDESREPGVDPITHALRLSSRKASAVRAAATGWRAVVAADTVVHRGDRLFDMPVDRDEAREHLRALSGGWHDVTTAVCVVTPGDLHQFSVTTAVRFRTLSDREVDAYLATGEADDKAGAYGIQGVGGVLVAEVRGSWTNVMGLPVEETVAALEGFGLRAGEEA